MKYKISPELKQHIDDFIKWANTEEGKLELEKSSLERQKIAINMWQRDFSNEMESRKDIPFCMQPLDASYWMNKRPEGNIEEIDKRITEIDSLLEKMEDKQCCMDLEKK